MSVPDYAGWTSEQLTAELDRLHKLKAWGPVTLIERELHDRQPIELAQDAYYRDNPAAR